jgi:hypothetical protein
MGDLEDCFRAASWIAFDTTWRDVSDRMKREAVFEAVDEKVQFAVFLNFLFLVSRFMR